MKVRLFRLKLSIDFFEHAAAVAIMLLSSHRFGVSIANDERRGATIALLVFAAGLCWQRSIFQRRAGRDATEAVAGFAAAAALLLKRKSICGDRSLRRRTEARLDDPPDGSLSAHHDIVKVKTLFISDVH